MTAVSVVQLARYNIAVFVPVSVSNIAKKLIKYDKLLICLGYIIVFVHLKHMITSCSTMTSADKTRIHTGSRSNAIAMGCYLSLDNLISTRDVP